MFGWRDEKEGMEDSFNTVSKRLTGPTGHSLDPFFFLVKTDRPPLLPQKMDRAPGPSAPSSASLLLQARRLLARPGASHRSSPPAPARPRRLSLRISVPRLRRCSLRCPADDAPQLGLRRPRLRRPPPSSSRGRASAARRRRPVLARSVCSVASRPEKRVGFCGFAPSVVF